ncbi:DUF1338-domain-containing protein [Meredithblackwellia eburnea MCA 4105]
MSESFVSPDVLRQQFASAMSGLFRKEVPLYGTLIELVEETNKPLLGPLSPPERVRLAQERHGAIRVGTAQELKTLARLFKLLGMEPVGYYDLSVASHPVHATAFRPVTDDSLLRNPFRVFTSLLRYDLIKDSATRELAEHVLAKRNIFTPGTLEFIEKAEKEGGIRPADASEFVSGALETFKWHSTASVSEEDYTRLLKASRLVADIVSFPGPHINHLTPCTLDIDIVQESMISRGIPPKSIIEGPPPRLCPILLRQTSFKALEERILFVDHDHTTLGHHTARFGEIESRGAALTGKGRKLFDEIFQRARDAEVVEGEESEGSHVALDEEGKPIRKLSANEVHQRHLKQFFKEFPDDWDTLRKQGLVYFSYSLVGLGADHNDDKVVSTTPVTLEDLLRTGKVVAKPLIYEDFLPASAAGIFNSNLNAGENKVVAGTPDQEAFEEALGSKVVDANVIYRERQSKSLALVRKAFPELVVEGGVEEL